MNRAPVPILTYHQIEAPPPRGTPYRSLVVSPGAFARQMGLLKLLGYTGLSMSALQPYLVGESDETLREQYRRWRQMAELKKIDDARPVCARKTEAP